MPYTQNQIPTEEKKVILCQNDVLNEYFLVLLHLKGKITTISILPEIRKLVYIDHNLRFSKQA